VASSPPPGRCRREDDDRQEGRAPRARLRRGRVHEPGRPVRPAPAGPPDRDLPRVRLRRDQREVAPHRRAGPFSDYLALASNTVALGTAAQAAGGLYADIVTGAGKVIDKNYDFTGIAADPRFKVDAQLATDTSAVPCSSVRTGPATAVGGGDIAGYPPYFNKGVSGKYWRAGDSVQTVTINGTPTGGTFVLSSGGNSATPRVQRGASTVQTAIQAWGGIYSTVTVTGSAGGPYTITFPAIASRTWPPLPPRSRSTSGLTGGTARRRRRPSRRPGAGGTDSLIRGIGGDWSQAAYGVGMDITIKVSTEANYFDGTNWHSAFQENLTLLLVEAYFGFVLGSPDAFVRTPRAPRPSSRPAQASSLTTRATPGRGRSCDVRDGGHVSVGRGSPHG
jgi:hypothetical protein